MQLMVLVGYRERLRIGFLCVTVAVVGACGTDTQTSVEAKSTARGTLIENPALRIASLTATGLEAQLNATSHGQQLLALSGAPSCGVDFYYIKYWTVGGAGESTTASGALMVPTGASSQCSGARPIVLYAHGTQTDQRFNIADITNASNAEGGLIAAMFAAQGYIVVAPNYAGYDASSLPYHPFLNGDQQSKDMIDALAASRSALAHTFTPSTSDGGKLFVTGYSEGGYVAMATHKALQSQGQAVAASAPMSGPYALEAFGDAIFYGSVNIGSTVFVPLIVRSYQTAYKNIYPQPADIFEPAYVSAATLSPSTTPLNTLFQESLLPQTALFSSTTPQTGNVTLDMTLAVPSNPVFALGFGSSDLITNAYRLSYVLDAVANPDGALPAAQVGVPLAAAPQHPARVALKANDMRSWTPQSPVLLCGGDQDPTVFFTVNTGTMQAYWSTLPPGLLTVLDVNAAVSGATDPFAAVKQGFQQTEASIVAGSGQQAAVQSYHATVAPFCTAAARGFFSQF